MSLIKHLKEDIIKGEGIEIIGDTFIKYKLVSKNRPLIITFPHDGNPFNHVTGEIDEKTPCWGFDYLSKLDINVLSFGTITQNNYFLNNELVKYLECISNLLDIFPERLGYAFSKGGFGIGAYNRLLKIDRSLLIHPVSTKKLDIVFEWDTRPTTKTAQKNDWEKKYNDVNPSYGTGYILFDPTNNIDVRHASRFSHLHPIKIYGLSHGVGINYLASNTSFLKYLVNNFIENKPFNFKLLKHYKRRLRINDFYFKSLISKTKSGTRKAYLQKQLKLITQYKNTLTEQEIDSLRDSAIAIEAYNLPLAIKLMTIASKQRPGGLFIKKKLEEYRKQASLT